MIITQRVYLTSDGRYVGEGDPDAAFLAYAAGTEVADPIVTRLGLEQWVTTGRPVQRAIVVPGVNTGTTHAPVGTIPPGHATASHPAVPAEVTDPVINADGTARGQVVPPTTARQQTPARAGAVKPVTRVSREV